MSERTPENRFESEPANVEFEPDLELCLLALANEANGKRLDRLDKYLIEQLEASYKKGESGGTFRCLVKGCELECIFNRINAKMKFMGRSGAGLCEQK